MALYHVKKKKKIQKIMENFRQVRYAGLVIDLFVEPSMWKHNLAYTCIPCNNGLTLSSNIL